MSMRDISHEAKLPFNDSFRDADSNSVIRDGATDRNLDDL